jgi:hypothetical protein
MAIPSKQIGWSTENNLLWQISKQLEYLTTVTGNASTGILTTKRNANNSTNNNINYCGIALGTGVSESSAVWTITRLTITANGSVTTATATNVAWTNRESVIYT